MRPMRLSTTSPAWFGALAVTTIVGCGGDAGRPAKTATPLARTEAKADADPAVRAAYARYARAVERRDAAAVCTSFSPRERRALGEAGPDIRAKPNCAAYVRAAFPERRGRGVEVERAVVEAGRIAALSLSDGVTVRLEKVGGRWFVTPDEFRARAAEVQVDNWRRSWCAAQPGTTRTRLRSGLGDPTSQTNRTDSWTSSGTDLTAFYDGRGQAERLESRGEPLPCAPVRTVSGR